VRVSPGKHDQVTRPEQARRAVIQSKVRMAGDDDVDSTQRTVESQSPFTPQQQRTEARAVEPELAQRLAQQVNVRVAAVLDG